MTKVNPTNALDECLSASNPLAAAERYPELREELLPLLRIAQQIRGVPQVVPSPEAEAASLKWLLSTVRFKAQKTRQAGFLEEMVA